MRPSKSGDMSTGCIKTRDYQTLETKRVIAPVRQTPDTLPSPSCATRGVAKANNYRFDASISLFTVH
jgi:hypothetical protein